MKSGRFVVHGNTYLSNCTTTKQKVEGYGWNFVNFWAAEFEMKNSFTAERELLDLATLLKRLNRFHSEYRRGFSATVNLTTWRMSVVTLNEGNLHESFYLMTVGLFGDFYKIKACLQRHRQLIWCFFIVSHGHGHPPRLTKCFTEAFDIFWNLYLFRFCGLPFIGFLSQRTTSLNL